MEVSIVLVLALIILFKILFFILVYSLAVLVDIENFRFTELSTMYGLLGTGLTLNLISLITFRG